MMFAPCISAMVGPNRLSEEVTGTFVEAETVYGEMFGLVLVQRSGIQTVTTNLWICMNELKFEKHNLLLTSLSCK